MAYGDFKGLPRRAASNKELREKCLLLLEIWKMVESNADLIQWLINNLIKIPWMVLLKIKSCRIKK